MHKTAGILLFSAGVIILLGILTAEIFYPTQYSISQNMISNLGATRPPDSIVRQPSADIFDWSLILAGALIIMAVYYVDKLFENRWLVCAIVVLGFGTFGVGIFPAYHIVAHPIVALAAFLGGGAAAVLSSKSTTKPFSYVAMVLGVLSLNFLFLGLFFPHDIVPILGAGGTERLVVYPMTLWLTGFGGYLMSKKG